jgi:alkylhydroperoxidase family enzyme
LYENQQLNSAPYCLASHTTIAYKLGWTEALHHAGDNKEFSEREKETIHLAEVIALNAHGYSESLRGCAASTARAEISGVDGCDWFFNYVNRFNDLLEIELPAGIGRGLATVAINVPAAVSFYG